MNVLHPASLHAWVQGWEGSCAAIFEEAGEADEAASGGCGQQPDLRGSLHVYFGARPRRRLPAGFPAVLAGKR